MVTILREDDSEEQIIIDPDANKPMQEVQGKAKKIKIFNPKLGTYGVTVTIGPSYATKRIESSERMMEFAKAMPQTASLIADLIAKNQDWEGADEMARRLAKAVPPQLMTPDVKDIPPQVQAVLQNQQNQIQQMTQALQGMQKQLQEKQTGFAISQDKINKDYEAKILAIVQKAEAAKQKADADGQKNASEELVHTIEAAKSVHEMMFPQEAQRMSLEDEIKSLKGHLAKKPKKISVKRNDKGFIESLDIEGEDPPRPQAPKKVAS